MKKLMLLALAVISAMLVVPTFASAAPVHVQTHPGGNPGAFVVHGGKAEWVRKTGGSTHASTVTGSGTFENTTTGTLSLTFHGMTSSLLGNCGQPPTHPEVAGGGTVTTTTLPFHLVTLPGGQPGILITSNNNHFMTYRCGGTSVVTNGNGILGTITAPACGGTSNTATLSFTQTGGVQNHKTYTGTTYNPTQTISFIGTSEEGMTAHATVTFGGARTLICT